MEHTMASSFTPELQAPSSTPPVLPPKPGSHEASGYNSPAPPPPPPPPPAAVSAAVGSPSSYAPPLPPPPPQQPVSDLGEGGAQSTRVSSAQGVGGVSGAISPEPASIPDPGEHWLPQMLQDKSKQDIASILASPSLLQALTHSPSTIHPSLSSSHAALSAALAENVDLASRLEDLESRLSRQRATTQAQLLSTHALERQWRQKQTDMDHALAPFAPASLYQRLGQGVQEQAAVCQAMEESFLEGGGGGGGDTEHGGVGGRGSAAAGEREVGDWVRRFREAKVQYYLREERKERWDEGRVGGWR